MSKVTWINKGWQPIEIGFCPDKKAWDKVMQEYKIDDPPKYPTSPAHAQYLCNSTTGDAFILITLNDKGLPLIEIIGLVVHEVTHALDFIYEHIGEEAPGMETKAYSMQALTILILDAWSKSRRKGDIFS